ncbi:MAG: hypothetical protein CMJ86_09035 [Planctomycetes bacterium]|nr:hypothetical protein [Planctomycetota bacterium]
MRVRSIPPLVLIGSVLTLALVPGGGSYTLLGHNLDFGARDFRVFNDFEDVSANDNTTPHANFPGALGATLAIWKAGVEWGSTLHGDGSGDPAQFDGIGSGGANFDFSYQGLATSPGPIWGNTHSVLHASDTGLLAFTEFANGGWRIRYYENWNWDDGPGSIGPNTYDLQSAATHEMGHALGLGHSTQIFSTMFSSMTAATTSWRSLTLDDRQGVQAIYGPASANKPVITSASFDGLRVHLIGSGFSGTGNEVWFTSKGPSSWGSFPKVTGVNSDGTSITVVPPPDAGSGDVLVRNTLSGFEALSNAWPITLACSAVNNYCPTTANSSGDGAVLGVNGSQSVQANDLVLTARGVAASQFSIFFYGQNQTSAQVAGGTLCVGGPFYRLGVSQASAAGDVLYALDLSTPPDPAGQIQAGQTWNFQLWYRDPAGAGSDFSDALSIPFCP